MKIGVLPGGGVPTVPPGRLSYSQNAEAAETSCRSRIIKKSEQRSHAMKGWFVPPIVIPILIAVSLVGFVSLNAWL
jgi:hypothetical protein